MGAPTDNLEWARAGSARRYRANDARQFAMLQRSAGVLIPLFSLRTEDDLGCGEILSLVPFLEFSASMGHRMVQLLPIDEIAPDQASPYSALSIFAIDPMYVSLDGIEGMPASELASARPKIGRGRAVDAMKVRAVKLAFLEEAYRSFLGRPRSGEREEFERFVEENRFWLDDYALFRTLKERFHFRSWQSWPATLRRRAPAALARARREHRALIDKYAYFQFLAHNQWRRMRERAAALGALLGGDLSFGPALDSAEVWANQELFDLSRSVGAPPDRFNPLGQRWGLPAPNWGRMRADAHRIWRARAGYASRLYDVLRIDHVVGLYRTYCYDTGELSPGAFVPADEEEQRAQGEEVMRAILDAAGGAQVVAEDLGSVPPWVRASLSAMGVPGYKVLRWEKIEPGKPEERFVPPAQYPELSIATTGTHDTESLIVYWRDADESERAKLIDALALDGLIRPSRTRLDDGQLCAVIEALYASPSVLVVMPMQDLFGWSARINVPGTVRAGNWTYRLPLTIERMKASPPILWRAARLRAIARRTGRA